MQTLTCIQNTFKHLTTLRHLKWPSTPTRALCINSTPRPLSSSSAGFLSVAVPLPEGGSQQCPTPLHWFFKVLIMPHFLLISCPCHTSFPCNFCKSWFVGLYLVRYSEKNNILSFVKEKNIDCLKGITEQSMKFKTSYNLLYVLPLANNLITSNHPHNFPSSHLCMFLPSINFLKDLSLLINLSLH